MQGGSSPSASALMDPRPTSLQELFSRSNSPPAQIQHQHISNTSSPNHLESLFHQLNAPPQQQQQAPSPPQPVHQQQQQPINQPGDSYSPAPPAEEQAAPPPQPTNAERQTALLSLLSGPPSAPRPVPPAQQVPSPPISHKSNASPSHNEAQGKYLLEQLMAGYVLSLDPANYLFPKMFCQRVYIMPAYARARGAGMSIYPLSLFSLSFSPYSVIRIFV